MTASRPERAGARRAGPVARLGVLAAAAVAVYVFEGLLPAPLPWARLGLSNVVVVIVLFGWGLRQAFLVNLVRIVAGNLALGLVLSPAFLFSVAGSLAGLAAMAAARWKLVPPLSVVGASCLGAVANNCAQVVVFSAAFAPSAELRGLLAAFVLVGIAVGLATGFVAAAVLRKVDLAGVGGVG